MTFVLGAILFGVALLLMGGVKIMSAIDDLRREMTELKASVAALSERLKNNPTEEEIASVAAELDEIGKGIDTMDPEPPPVG